MLSGFICLVFLAQAFARPTNTRSDAADAAARLERHLQTQISPDGLPGLSDTETVWSLGSEQVVARDSNSILSEVIDLQFTESPRASRRELIRAMDAMAHTVLTAEHMVMQYIDHSALGMLPTDHESMRDHF